MSRVRSQDNERRQSETELLEKRVVHLVEEKSQMLEELSDLKAEKAILER